MTPSSTDSMRRPDDRSQPGPAGGAGGRPRGHCPAAATPGGLPGGGVRPARRGGARAAGARHACRPRRGAAPVRDRPQAGRARPGPPRGLADRRGAHERDGGAQPRVPGRPGADRHRPARRTGLARPADDRLRPVVLQHRPGRHRPGGPELRAVTVRTDSGRDPGHPGRRRRRLPGPRQGVATEPLGGPADPAAAVRMADAAASAPARARRADAAVRGGPRAGPRLRALRGRGAQGRPRRPGHRPPARQRAARGRAVQGPVLDQGASAGRVLPLDRVHRCPLGRGPAARGTAPAADPAQVPRVSSPCSGGRA